MFRCVRDLVKCLRVGVYCIPVELLRGLVLISVKYEFIDLDINSGLVLFRDVKFIG